VRNLKTELECVEMTSLSNNPKPTQILNWEHSAVHALANELQLSIPLPRAFVQAAHEELVSGLQPVYDLDELQPISITLDKGRGHAANK
jgi:hypothetical protein